MQPPPPPTIRSSIAAFAYFDAQQLAMQLAAMAKAGDELVRLWLGRLLDEGVKRTFLEDLMSAAGQLELALLPGIVGKNKVKYSYVFADDSTATRKAWLLMKPGDEDGAERAVIQPRIAHALLFVIQAGENNRIHRCKLPECSTIFYGDVRARWCSSTCGSKARVREKRKRDRRR